MKVPVSILVVGFAALFVENANAQAELIGGVLGGVGKLAGDVLGDAGNIVKEVYHGVGEVFSDDDDYDTATSTPNVTTQALTSGSEDGKNYDTVTLQAQTSGSPPPAISTLNVTTQALTSGSEDGKDYDTVTSQAPISGSEDEKNYDTVTSQAQTSGLPPPATSTPNATSQAPTSGLPPPATSTPNVTSQAPTSGSKLPATSTPNVTSQAPRSTPIVHTSRKGRAQRLLEDKVKQLKIRHKILEERRAATGQAHTSRPKRRRNKRTINFNPNLREHVGRSYRKKQRSPAKPVFRASRNDPNKLLFQEEEKQFEIQNELEEQLEEDEYQVDYIVPTYDYYIPYPDLIPKRNKLLYLEDSAPFFDTSFGSSSYGFPL